MDSFSGIFSLTLVAMIESTLNLQFRKKQELVVRLYDLWDVALVELVGEALDLHELHQAAEKPHHEPLAGPGHRALRSQHRDNITASEMLE